MQVTLTITNDGLSPDLARRVRVVSDKSRFHRAMGIALVSLTKRAFNDPSLRPGAWPALAGGGAARLRKSGTLAESPRVVSATSSGVTVGTDRKYAAIHQLGGKTKAHVIRPKFKKALKTPFGVFAKVNHPGSKIPARPYFPFYRDGRPTPRAVEDLHKAVDETIKAS